MRNTADTKKNAKVIGLLIALLTACTATATEPSIFVVTTVADSGQGTLRQAILDANAATYPDHGSNRIEFDIPGVGMHAIRPQSMLPGITQSVVIDGYTQPGSSENTLVSGATNAVLAIELNGADAGAGADGLRFYMGTGGSRVRGLAINRFRGAGIRVSTTGITVAGNFIGTDVSGVQARGNGTGIVFVSLEPYGAPTVGQYDSGSYFPAARNIISGNLGAGVEVVAASGAVYPPGIIVRSNLIGADATGTHALGNGGDGIDDAGIGSSGSFAGGIIENNVIVANGGNGITALGQGTNIANNLIGVGVGTLGANGPALGNVGDGVHADGNAIGVTLIDNAYTSGFAGRHASIAHNGGAGLWIGGNAMVDVVAQGFHDNGGLGIDLAPTGPNPNDIGDADAGPNELLNSPVLDSVNFDADSGYGDLAGHLDSNAGSNVELSFYLDDTCDGSGLGEGARRLPTNDGGSTGTLSTDTSGHTAFTLHSMHLKPGSAISVFTRRFADDAPYIIVSEFSNCLLVPGNDTIFIDGFDGAG